MATWIKRSIIIGILMCALFLAFVINRPVKIDFKGDLNMPPMAQLIYDQGFSDTGILGYRKLAETEFLSLYIQDHTSYFAVKDKRNDYTWFSNDVKPDSLARTESQRQLQRSTLQVNYLNKDNTVSRLNNFNHSINYKTNFEDAFTIEEIENGFITTYKITNREPRGFWFPPYISKERFIEKVFNPVQQFGNVIDRRQLDQYYGPKEDDPEIYVIRQLRPDEKTGLLNMNELSGAQVQTLFRLFYELGSYGNTLDELGDFTGVYHLDDVRFDNEMHDIFIDTNQPEFIIELHITLNNDHLEVRVEKVIRETLPEFKITSIQVLPYFGAIRNQTNEIPSEGQLLIPEGSGGLINFNNQKISAISYTSYIYGRDIVEVPETRPQSDVGAAMPIFGVIQPHNSFLGIISEGDAQSRILSDISGKVDSYNKISTEFIFLQSGSYQLANNRITIWNLTPALYRPTIRYYFFAEETSNYTSMAHLYGQYLAHNLSLVFKEFQSRRLAIDIIGSYTYNDFVLWLPVRAIGSLTTYNEATEMLKILDNQGWNQTVVSYVGWFNGGIQHSLPRRISFDAALGSRRDRERFENFIQTHGMTLYYDVNFVRDYSSPWHYTSRHSSRIIGGQVARYFTYDRATGQIRTQSASYTLNNMPALNQTIEMFQQRALRHSISGLSLRYLGNTLYGDFKRNNEVSRNETFQQTQRLMEQIEISLMLRNPHLYALTFADVIVDVKTNTSQLSVVDTAIPFYQLAVAPYVEYFAPSYNMDGAYLQQTYLLHLLMTGSNPKVTLGYQSAQELAGTDFENYFDTYFKRHEHYLASLKSTWEELNIDQSYLISHEILQPDVVKVKYSQGQQFVINLGVTPVVHQGVLIQAQSYLIWGGE